jgi:FO synthase
MDYVRQMSELVVEETTLFPHANPGIMTDEDLTALRPSNLSAGLMLENISPRLMEPGMPHHNCPDKDPELRSEVIRAAERVRVPFTTGVLVGIGETTGELVDSLFALAELDEGQIQEVIIQNFRAKANTRMRRDPEPTAEYFMRVVALARVIMRPEVSVQVPPNLSERYEDLLQAGVNDWGGVSPVTIDWVNPEQPWPHLDELTARTAAAGFELRARLPTYPDYLRPEWVHPELLVRASGMVDDDGYAVVSHDYVSPPSPS